MTEYETRSLALLAEISDRLRGVESAIVQWQQDQTECGLEAERQLREQMGKIPDYFPKMPTFPTIPSLRNRG